MLLAQFIADSIDTIQTRLSDDYKMVRKSMQSHLGQDYDTTDLLQLAAPGWVDAYRQHLLDTYLANKSPERLRTMQANDADGLKRRRAATAANHLRILRRLIRTATASGIFPNIDILADYPELARHKNVALPDSLGALQRLLTLRLADTNHFIEKYLISLSLCGAPLNSLAAMAANLAGSNLGKLNLPHLGIDIDPSAWTIRHLKAYSNPSAPVQTAPTGNNNTSSAIRATLADNNIGLYAGAAPFVDWLNLCHSLKLLNARQMRLLIARRLDPNVHLDQSVCDTVRQATDTLAAIISNNETEPTRYWVAIKTYRQPAHQLAKHLLTDTGTNRIDINNKQLLCLYRDTHADRQQKITRPADNDIIALKNILFANITTNIGREIEQTHPSAHIISGTHNGMRRYSPISVADLNRMLRVLRLFQGVDYTAVLSLTDQTDHHDGFAIEQPVTIRREILGKDTPGVIIKRITHRVNTPELAGHQANTSSPSFPDTGTDASTPDITLYRVYVSLDNGMQMLLDLHPTDIMPILDE